MSSTVADCKYVLDVIAQLSQSGGALPNGLPTEKDKRDSAKVLRFGVQLAFESDSYWRSLPKKFTYTLWGYKEVITTRKLLAELQEVMRPYQNRL